MGWICIYPFFPDYNYIPFPLFWHPIILFTGSWFHSLIYSKLAIKVTFLCLGKSKLSSYPVITLNPLTNPPAGVGESIFSFWTTEAPQDSSGNQRTLINFSSRKRPFRNDSLVIWFTSISLSCTTDRIVSLTCISFFCSLFFSLGEASAHYYSSIATVALGFLVPATERSSMRYLWYRKGLTDEWNPRPWDFLWLHSHSGRLTEGAQWTINKSIWRDSLMANDFPPIYVSWLDVLPWLQRRNEALVGFLNGACAQGTAASDLAPYQCFLYSHPLRESEFIYWFY